MMELHKMEHVIQLSPTQHSLLLSLPVNHLQSTGSAQSRMKICVGLCMMNWQRYSGGALHAAAAGSLGDRPIRLLSDHQQTFLVSILQLAGP